MDGLIWVSFSHGHEKMNSNERESKMLGAAVAGLHNSAWNISRRKQE
jgi:hypothetical protein